MDFLLIYRFRKIKYRPLSNYPIVSVIKSMRGLEYNIYENFLSFCQQDYPGNYEIIFVTSSKDDPALAVAYRLKTEFKDIPISMVISSLSTDNIDKINNLITGAEQARYDILVCSDSDVEIDLTCIRRMVEWLNMEDEIAAVCSGYNCRAEGGIFSVMEAITETQTCLIHYNFLGKPYFIGGCIAIKKGWLEKIGGFTAIADYITEDFPLAQRFKQKGFKVLFIPQPVLVKIGNMSFSDWWNRLQRRIISFRMLSPLGGISVPAITLLSLLYFIIALINFNPLEFKIAASLFIVAVLVRVLPMLFYDKLVLKGKASIFYWLLPITDIFWIFTWISILFSNTISWRGITYAVHSDGRVSRIS